MSASDDVARLDRETRARFGKPLMECGWDELQELLDSHQAEATRLVADVDRADVALRDAQQCGCPIRVPLLPDGSPDIGRGRVQHTEQCINHTKENER